MIFISLFFSLLGRAEICEISLHSTPYKPGLLIKSFVTIECENLPSGTTEFLSREEATETFKQISVSWALSKWNMTTCKSSTTGSKYSCKYESPK